MPRLAERGGPASGVSRAAPARSSPAREVQPVREDLMLKHTGSARDPIELEPSSKSSTPGMGWVIAGIAAICLVVAIAHNSNWLQNSAAHVANAASTQG